MVKLTSHAEQRAKAAEALPAFDKVNLLGIKTQVAHALSLIGREGMFWEYSIHDVVHIDKMLLLLDRIIPSATQERMTPADWLLTVLGIYFHDLGLLVTRAEFKARAESGYREYCDSVLFAGDDGREYRSKVAALNGDEEKFLYQEFIRAHHAERIADWIRGHVDNYRGVAENTAASVNEVLAPLPRVFLDDLASVCASHHLADLGDTSKYSTSTPYGDSQSETANVQYAAVLLRTADLLHITKDRTPSIQFRLIDPQDPVSQGEWAKQQAVRSVRPQRGRDREGNLTDDAPRDTYEVFAEFEDTDGFFGLTSYLQYAAGQLRQSHEWVRASSIEQGTGYEFPWRAIDDTGVTARGFLPERLSFSLDQKRILDLLTGHTLYNDTSVVVRELVQNAIDAVRLQTMITGRSDAEGEVSIEWHPGTRELVVRDNGTGMTQAVVENNLLKAGASRYQEEEFKKTHQEFSPISRFGIGVLSAFMIADSVEIITSSLDEAEARHLTLKSVHGRYLVRLLDKVTDDRVKCLGANGTEVRLVVRESASMPDVVRTVERWIVIPRCSVMTSIAGSAPEPVGSTSCGEALTAALQHSGFEIYDERDGAEPPDSAVRVVEVDDGDVQTAFAVSWNRYFREWGLLAAEPMAKGLIQRGLGTCIEGIRVEENTAGFRGDPIVAICNASGSGSPKTNVARSGIEATVERTAMLQRVYRAYVSHVTDEINKLISERGFSATWAAQEAGILLAPIFAADRTFKRSGENRVVPVEPQVLDEALAAEPLLIVEDEGVRLLMSASELATQKRLWTVDSAFVRAGESLLREIPADASLASLAEGLDSSAVSLPPGVTLVGYSRQDPLYTTLLRGRGISHITINREQRRADLAWDSDDDGKRWLNLRERSTTIDRYMFGSTPSSIMVALQNPKVEGRADEVAVRAHGYMLLFADTPLAAYVRDVMERLGNDLNLLRARHLVGDIVERYLLRSKAPDDLREFIEAAVTSDSGRGRHDLVELDQQLDLDALATAMKATPPRTFDTWAWTRRGIDL